MSLFNIGDSVVYIEQNYFSTTWHLTPKTVGTVIRGASPGHSLVRVSFSHIKHRTSFVTITTDALRLVKRLTKEQRILNKIHYLDNKFKENQERKKQCLKN